MMARCGKATPICIGLRNIRMSGGCVGMLHLLTTQNVAALFPNASIFRKMKNQKKADPKEPILLRDMIWNISQASKTILPVLLVKTIEWCIEKRAFKSKSELMIACSKYAYAKNEKEPPLDTTHVGYRTSIRRPCWKCGTRTNFKIPFFSDKEEDPNDWRPWCGCED